MSRTTRSRRYCVTAITAVLAVVAAMGFTGMPSLAQTATAAGGLREIGRLERAGADVRAALGNAVVSGSYDARVSGTAIVVPSSRQMWQVYPYTENFVARTALVVRDLDSLQLKKTMIVLEGMTRSVAGNGGEWVHAVDEKRGRLFLVTDFGILRIDMKTFEMVRFSQGAPTERKGGTTFPTMAGLTYDPYGDRLLGVYGFPANASALGVFSYLYETNPETGATSVPRPLRACTGPFPPHNGSQTLASPILIPSAEYLYVPCQRSGNVGAVIRINRARALDPAEAEEVVVGPVSIEAVMVDPPSSRLIMITIKGEMWVFDAKTMAFVGVVAATTDSATAQPIGYGIDDATGRLFFQSPAFGLGVADGRFSPIPQARTLPSRKAPGQERIWADARTNRLFVLSGNFFDKEGAYRIFEIGAAPVPPPPPDPDRSTVDVDEKPGLTSARYNANGSGYGARVLLANGVSTLPPAPAVGQISPTAQVIASHINSKCGYTDRELSAGRVFKAEYDTGSTAAQAMAVQVDDRTQQDLQRPSRCDITVRDHTATERFSGIFATAPPLQAHDVGPGWNHKPAECTSSEGGEEKSGAGIDGDQPLGTSKVTCPLPAGRLVADAESRLTGAVTVGRAWSHVEIARTAKGVTSTVVAEARDIDIAGVIHLAEVRSTAESTANGRPSKDPQSKHTVTIKGVTIAGTSVCGAMCPIPTVLEALNQAVSGRAQFRVASGLDRDLLEGSPKGALTAVQKSGARQTSDLALIGDFTTEVPGLEMINYNDNRYWGRARQLYQFAGVSTVANYNITIQPTGSGFPNLDDATDSDDLESIGGLGGDGMSDLSSDELGALSGGSDGLGYETAANDSGGLGGFFRALGRGIRLFWSNPRQALLLLTAWALLLLPAALSRRRRLLAAARSV